MRHKNTGFIIAIAAIISLMIPANAFATLEQAKTYKSVFNTEKPKCLTCHVDKIPKKDDGQHEPNDYGKKLIAANPKPDEATYKQVGPNPDAVYS